MLVFILPTEKPPSLRSTHKAFVVCRHGCIGSTGSLCATHTVAHSDSSAVHDVSNLLSCLFPFYASLGRLPVRPPALFVHMHVVSHTPGTTSIVSVPFRGLPCSERCASRRSRECVRACVPLGCDVALCGVVWRGLVRHRVAWIWDADVGSSIIAEKIVSLCRGYARSLTVEIGICLEGR